jgi:hypothetical protein
MGAPFARPKAVYIKGGAFLKPTPLIVEFKYAITKTLTY